MSKITSYLTSMCNNIFIDEYQNVLMFGSDKGKYIVNPMKFAIYFKKKKIIFNFFYPILVFISPLLSICKITFDLFKIIYLKLKSPLLKSTSADMVLVLTDVNVLQFIKKRNIQNYVVLSKPINDYSLDKETTINHISSLSIIKYRQIILNYVLSLFSIYAIIKKYGFKNSIYSINSFEWMIMYDVLKSDYFIQFNKLVFSNQKDRWAILFDRHANQDLILVQHGTNIIKSLPSEFIESYLLYLEEHKSWAPQMPIRYLNVNTLITFSNDEGDHLICGEFATNPNIIEISGYNLIISSHEKISKNERILLIGNINVFYEEESYFILNLNNKKYHLVIKAHPTTRQEEYFSILNNVNITTENPDVDFVVSYNSTLAYEYQSLGYEVFIYNDMNSLKDIVNNLNNR